MFPAGALVPGTQPGKARPSNPACVSPLNAGAMILLGALRPEVYRKLNEPGPVQAEWFAGETVEIKLDIIFSHGGSYAFFLCLDGSDTWECFEKTPLTFAGTGQVWKHMGPLPRVFSDNVVLPDVQCDRCTLAWRWDALFEPSVFINCIDVTINGGDDTPPQPEPQPGPTLPPLPDVDDAPTYNPYMVLSLADSGKCLDVGGAADNGAVVQVRDCNGDVNQQWRFENDTIKLALDTAKCIDVPVSDSGIVAASADLQLWDCNGLPNQQFAYDPDAGTVSLANSADAPLCMDAGSAEPGQVVQIRDCDGEKSQQFYVPPPFGAFTISAGVDAGKCLDLPGQSAVNGARLQLWDCNGLMGQQWLFDAEDAKIRYMDDPSKCVDVPGGEAVEGQLLWLWDCVDVPGQVVGYDAAEKTIYFASSNDATLCWNLIAGDTSNGNAIGVSQCDGSGSQQWEIGYEHSAAKRTLNIQREVLA
jgi:hypothetical protein